jgi:hypothetical protein
MAGCFIEIMGCENLIDSYIVFSCLDIPVKHSLSLFIYYVMVTLAVLDIGGGKIAPWLDDTVTSIATEAAFENTRYVLKNFEGGISEWENLLDPDIEEDERTRRIAENLRSKIQREAFR